MSKDPFAILDNPVMDEVENVELPEAFIDKFNPKEELEIDSEDISNDVEDEIESSEDLLADIVEAGKVKKEETTTDEEGNTVEVETPEEASKLFLTSLTEELLENFGFTTEEGSELKVENPEDLVEIINEIIESKSEPKYSSELSKDFDLFIANGGNPKDFFTSLNDAVDYTDFTPTTDKEKVNTAREYLVRSTSFKPEKIEKELNKLIENEELDEFLEEEALPFLQEQSVKNYEQLLEAQELKKQQEIREREKIINYHANIIDKAESLGGFPVAKTYKEDFKNFVLGIDKTGKTPLAHFLDENPSAFTEIAWVAYLLKNKIDPEEKINRKANKNLNERLSNVGKVITKTTNK